MTAMTNPVHPSHCHPATATRSPTLSRSAARTSFPTLPPKKTKKKLKKRKKKKLKLKKSHLLIFHPFSDLSPLKMTAMTRPTLSTHCHPDTATRSPTLNLSAARTSFPTVPPKFKKKKKNQFVKRPYLAQFSTVFRLITTQNDRNDKCKSYPPLPPSHCHPFTHPEPLRRPHQLPHTPPRGAAKHGREPPEDPGRKLNRQLENTAEK
jgi:hypothetical protein